MCDSLSHYYAVPTNFIRNRFSRKRAQDATIDAVFANEDASSIVDEF